MKKRIAILVFMMAIAFHTAKAEMKAVQVHASQVERVITQLSEDNQVIDIVPYTKSVTVNKTGWSMIRTLYTGEVRKHDTFFVITYMPRMVPN